MTFFHAYLVGSAVTLLWVCLKVPPRTLVECVVSVLIVALWPAAYAYTLWTMITERRL